MGKLLIIISSPSGGGKTTISKKLLQDSSSPIFGKARFSISVTTRQKRGEEIDGKDYFFVSDEEFHNMVERGEFLEYATIFGHMYGTPRKGISQEMHTIFDIDFQGYNQVKEKIDVVSIFLLPPSLESLKERIKNRGDIDTVEINRRIGNASTEIEQAKNYDYIILNNDIQKAFEEICSIIQAEIIKKNTLKLAKFQSCQDILQAAKQILT